MEFTTFRYDAASLQEGAYIHTVRARLGREADGQTWMGEEGEERAGRQASGSAIDEVSGCACIQSSAVVVGSSELPSPGAEASI